MHAQNKDTQLNEHVLAVQQALHEAHIEVQQAFAQQNLQAIDTIIKEKVAMHVNSIFNAEILVILTEAETYYVKLDASLLAEFYCIKAHTYYFGQHVEMARHYYQLAMSYGLQYEKFGTIAASMTNLLVMQHENYTIEQHLQLAESIPLIYSYSSTFDVETQCRRLFNLISAQLAAGEVEKAARCLQFIESKNLFHKPSRTWVQLHIFKALLCQKQQKFKEALRYYNQVLEISLTHFGYYEMVENIYRNLHEIINDPLQTEPLIEEFEKFQWFKRQDKTQLERYAAQHEATYYHPLMQSSVTEEQFKQQALELKEQAEKTGVSIICVECFEVAEVDKLDALLAFFNVLKDTLAIADCTTYVKNANCLMLTIVWPEEELRAACEQARQALIRKKLYVSVSNHVTAQWQSFEHGMMLAHANIYYEMEKPS